MRRCMHELENRLTNHPDMRPAEPSDPDDISSTFDEMFLEDANTPDLDESQLARREDYRMRSRAKLAAQGGHETDQTSSD